MSSFEEADPVAVEIILSPSRELQPIELLIIACTASRSALPSKLTSFTSPRMAKTVPGAVPGGVTRLEVDYSTDERTQGLEC